jgi:hypothetical protein
VLTVAARAVWELPLWLRFFFVCASVSSRLLSTAILFCFFFWFMGIKDSRNAEVPWPSIDVLEADEARSLTFLGAGSEGCVLTDPSSTTVRKVFIKLPHLHTASEKGEDRVMQVMEVSMQDRDWEAHNFMEVLHAIPAHVTIDCIPKDIWIGEAPLSVFSHSELAKCVEGVSQDVIATLQQTHGHIMVPYIRYAHAGMDLHSVCMRRAVTQEDMLRAFRVLFENLGAMQAVGIFHLDIKPSNMTWHQPPMSAPHIMLIDFGFGGVSTRSYNVQRIARLRIQKARPDYRYLPPEFFVLSILYDIMQTTPADQRKAVVTMHEKVKGGGVTLPIVHLLKRFKARSEEEVGVLRKLFECMQNMLLRYYRKTASEFIRCWGDKGMLEKMLHREAKIIVRSWDVYSTAVTCMQCVHDVRPVTGSREFVNAVKVLGKNVLTVPVQHRAKVHVSEIATML